MARLAVVIRVVLGWALLVQASASTRAEDWPRWRGPDGNAVSAETDLPTHWDTRLNVDWRIEVEGEGSSSPIVSSDAVFLTSSLESGSRRLLQCFDRRTGERRWSREIADDDPEVASSMTGHAAATPAVDGQRVVAAFGRAGLVCYDFDGRLLWHVELGRFESELGLASSPVIERSRVVLVCDHDGDHFNSFDSYLLAVDLADGRTKWKTERRGLYRSWSTPIIVPASQHRELVVNAQDELRGYDPDSGRLLWQVRGMTGWVTPSPVTGHGLVFAASGKSGPVMAVRPGGQRDVTETNVVWKLDAAGPYVCSPLVYGNCLYVHNESGVLSCYEAATGKLQYRERLDGKFVASGVAGDGKLYLTNDEGTTYVVKAGAAFKLLAANPLAEYTLASPAISGGRLFIRTKQHLYCIAPGTERSR